MTTRAQVIRYEVIGFFARNREEELCTNDVMDKWDLDSDVLVRGVMRPLMVSGLIEVEKRNDSRQGKPVRSMLFYRAGRVLRSDE